MDAWAQSVGQLIVKNCSLHIWGVCYDAQGTMECAKCGVMVDNTVYFQNRGCVCDACQPGWLAMWTELATGKCSTGQDRKSGVDGCNKDRFTDEGGEKASMQTAETRQ
jgi:hypothetical protein